MERKAEKRVHADENELTQRCCRKYRETGHNKITCRKDVGILSK
jgi:hypothetical protein